MFAHKSWKWIAFLFVLGAMHCARPFGVVPKKWQLGLPQRVRVAWQTSVREKKDSDHASIFAGVAVGEDMVYVGGHGHFLWALHKETGKIVWKVDLDASPSCTPLYVSKNQFDNKAHLFVCNQEGLLMALDAQTGALQWKYQTTAPTYGKPLFVKAANEADAVPMALFLSQEGTLYALNAHNGEKQWEYNQSFFDVTDVRNDASPVIQDQIVYAGLPNGRVVALEADTGEEKWSKVIKDSSTSFSVVRTPVVVGDVVYVSAYGMGLYALDRTTGSVLWFYGLKQYGNIGAGHIAVEAKTSTVCLGIGIGGIHCLDAKGHVLWREVVPAVHGALNEILIEGIGSVAGPLIWQDQVLFSAANKGFYMVGLVHGQRTYHLFKKHGISAPPVLENNRVYLVTSDADVVALDLSTSPL